MDSPILRSDVQVKVPDGSSTRKSCVPPGDDKIPYLASWLQAGSSSGQQSEYAATEGVYLIKAPAPSSSAVHEKER